MKGHLETVSSDDTSKLVDSQCMRELECMAETTGITYVNATQNSERNNSDASQSQCDFSDDSDF